MRWPGAGLSPEDSSPDSFLALPRRKTGSVGQDLPHTASHHLTAFSSVFIGGSVETVEVMVSEVG